MPGGSGVSWQWLALGVLAVWRLTHLLHVEHGPWGLLTRARDAAARRGLGEGVACFYCLSVWTAAPVAWWLAPTWPGRLVAWLALSAGAILIEVRWLGGPAAPSLLPTTSPTTEESTDGVLRERA